LIYFLAFIGLVTCIALLFAAIISTEEKYLSKRFDPKEWQ